MRPTMMIRCRIWVWMVDRILAHKSVRLGRWALACLDFWDTYLNVLSTNHEKREHQ